MGKRPRYGDGSYYLSTFSSTTQDLVSTPDIENEPWKEISIEPSDIDDFRRITRKVV